jgi:hypothetical protein
MTKEALTMDNGPKTNWRFAILIGLMTSASLLALALAAIHRIASHSL